jgi:hypothetical protein
MSFTFSSKAAIRDGRVGYRSFGSNAAVRAGRPGYLGFGWGAHHSPQISVCSRIGKIVGLGCAIDG